MARQARYLERTDAGGWVRPDAWATNAKHVLLSIRNGMDSFFEWLAVQKDQDTGSEQSGNGLERSVRSACRDPRTVSELWCIAVFSDGVFQPMMMAINESDTTQEHDEHAIGRAKHSASRKAVVVRQPH